jgi:hypothetical protein
MKSLITLATLLLAPQFATSFSPAILQHHTGISRYCTCRTATLNDANHHNSRWRIWKRPRLIARKALSFPSRLLSRQKNANQHNGVSSSTFLANRQPAKATYSPRRRPRCFSRLLQVAAPLFAALLIRPALAFAGGGGMGSVKTPMVPLERCVSVAKHR